MTKADEIITVVVISVLILILCWTIQKIYVMRMEILSLTNTVITLKEKDISLQNEINELENKKEWWERQ